MAVGQHTVRVGKSIPVLTCVKKLSYRKQIWRKHHVHTVTTAYFPAGGGLTGSKNRLNTIPEHDRQTDEWTDRRIYCYINIARQHSCDDADAR